MFLLSTKVLTKTPFLRELKILNYHNYFLSD
jgi:hypothetical protein